jgi:predicted MFS family arabinose efflux permease
MRSPIDCRRHRVQTGQATETADHLAARSLFPPADSRGELRSGWRLVLSAMLGVGLGFPTVPFYSIGIFAPTLARTFGWPFASILGGLALTPAVLLIGGPLVGQLVDRHGARKIAAISLVALGTSYMTLALSNGSLVKYYASWTAIAVAGMGATPISFTRAVNAAFRRQRGIALGITMAGTGLFALGVKPLGGWLMNVAGWRGAIAIIGLLPIVVGVPSVLWGLPGKGADDLSASRTKLPSAGMTLREALRGRVYWLLVLTFVPIAFAAGAPLPNMENILRSVHIPAGEIVTLTSLIGVTLITGRLIGGWLIDQLWAPLVGALILSGAALGCWMLSPTAVSHTQALTAIVLLGFAGGVEVDLMAYLVARYIGVRSYGTAYGLLYGLFAIGAGAGPSLLGHAYDRAGNYTYSMRACALLLLCSAGLLLVLGPYPNEKNSLMEDAATSK